MSSHMLTLSTIETTVALVPFYPTVHRSLPFVWETEQDIRVVHCTVDL